MKYDRDCAWRSGRMAFLSDSVNTSLLELSDIIRRRQIGLEKIAND